MAGAAKQWACLDLHSGRLVNLPPPTGKEEKGYVGLHAAPDGRTVTLVSQSGALLLLDGRSLQLVATLQGGQGGRRFCTQAATYATGAEALLSAADGGTVRVWDVARRACVHTFTDSGGMRVTALAASAGGEHVAVGADSGAVSLYNLTDALASCRPQPLKEFLSLRHAVTGLDFSPSGEALAFSSKYAKRSMRVAHVGSRSVFPNWPTAKTPLNLVQCSAFSPDSRLLGVGTDQGKVLLYQLNHYV